MFSRQRFACALVLVCAFSGRAVAQPKEDEVVPVEDEVPVQDDSAPPEKKPSEQKPGEQKPSEQKPPEQKAPEQKPSEQRPPAEQKPSEQKAPAQAPAAPAGDEGGGGEGGDDPARPPPRGKGVVWGVVVDERQEPLDEVQVTVEGKGKIRVITDLEGRYRLELVPGVYKIRFWAELHHAEVVQGIRVEVGKVMHLGDTLLKPDTGAVDVIEVETEADKAAVEGQILTRQKAAAVGDSVGRAEIARTPDKNAAQAAQRVVGATIVNGRFVYVRGLGERYTNALMNDAPLPSPEPDRAAVPLDLFPTMAIESLTIAKTFTPDVPGDFAGGSVRILTREIPSKFVFQASVTGGINSQSTFHDRLDYPGSKSDWLGYDGGARSLPPGFPTYKLDTPGKKPDGSDVTEADLTNAGRAINTYMSTRRTATPPDHSMSVVMGNGWDFGKDRKFGVLAALSYGRSYQLIKDEISRDLVFSSGALNRDRDYVVERGIDNVTWGGLGSIAYQFNKNHRLALVGLHSQIADDTTFETTGIKGAALNIHDQRLQFVSRSMNLGQLRGEHVFPDLGRGEFDWTAWISEASRDQPDTRSIAYSRANDAPTPDWTYVNDSFSGRHFWASQSETANGGKVDWTQPLANEDSKVKFGAFVNLRDRDFTSRNLALRPRAFSNIRDPAAAAAAEKQICPGPNPDFNKCADELLINPNLADGGALRLQESTLDTDAYRASLNVYAGYLMADVALLKGFRMIAGERVEVTRQTIDPFDQFNPDTKKPGGDIKSTDLLPTLATVIDVGQKSKVRASVTRTLARPQLRELAPFAFYEFFGGRAYSGNPDLKITHITNVDLRLEHFPTLKEVLAASLFYKRFKDPIETIIVASGDKGTVTYQNADGANLFGAELEARKGLDFLSKSLKDFSLIANLTVALSKIELSGQARNFLTNADRPMVYQSPYIVNAAIDYENEHGTSLRLSWNLYGARITEVGSAGLPDVYQQPRHQFDFTAAQQLGKHFAIKFVATNIPNSPWVHTQGKDKTDDNVVWQYTTGSIYSLTATYTL